MKNIVKLLLLAMCSSVIFSCSSSSKKICSTTDWTAQGKKDGAKGLPEETILETKKLCKSKESEISVSDYKTGWLKGIEEYCSPKNAFTLGVNSKDSKADNCPVELMTSYKENYERGTQLSKLNKEISDYEAKINSLEEQKSKLQKKLTSTKYEVTSLEKKISNLSDQKAKIRKNAKKLNQDAVNYKIQ